MLEAMSGSSAGNHSSFCVKLKPCRNFSEAGTPLHTPMCSIMLFAGNLPNLTGPYVGIGVGKSLNPEPCLI